MTLKSVKVNSAGNYRCVASSAKNSVASEDQYMLVIGECRVGHAKRLT